MVIKTTCRPNINDALIAYKAKTVGNTTKTIRNNTILLTDKAKTVGNTTKTISNNTILLTDKAKTIGGTTKTISDNIILLTDKAKTIGGTTKTISDNTILLTDKAKTIGGTTKTISDNIILLTDKAKTVSGTTKTQNDTNKINHTADPAHIASTFSFCTSSSSKIKVSSSKIKKSLQSSLVAKHKRTVVNFKVTDLPAPNSTFAKWRVSWVLVSSVFIHNFVLADSVKLRKPPLRKSAKRYSQCLKTTIQKTLFQTKL